MLGTRQEPKSLQRRTITQTVVVGDLVVLRCRYSNCEQVRALLGQLLTSLSGCEIKRLFSFERGEVRIS